MSRFHGVGYVLFFAALTAPCLQAQSAGQIEAEYRVRVHRADAEGALPMDFVRAAEASRFMRRFDEAAFYLERAEVNAREAAELNAALRERLNYQLAVGVPLANMKATFEAARSERRFPVIVVAGWLNAFPELLAGGEYDALIGSLSADAADSERRCACYAQKAWMHRVSGRMDASRIYWDSLNASWPGIPESANPFDEADLRAQLARNLARAGRHDEARAELAAAMAVDVPAFESVSILRRRAQTYAELGEVQLAVADLQALLEIPSPITPHTIRDRVTWEPIRSDPLFEALLRKYPAS